MKSSKARKRGVWVGAAILFWLAVGVAVPFIFDFTGDEVQFDSAGVVAAPRDSFKITETLLIDKLSRSTVSGGTLAIAAPKGKLVTAESSAALLKRGEAVLLLDSGELTIGATADQIDAAASDASAPLTAALQKGRFKALALRRSTIIVALPNGHRERLTRANIQLIPSSNGTFEAKGEGFWRGQRSKFSISTSAPVKDGKVPVKLDFKATLLDFTYDGSYELAGPHSIQGPATVHLKNTEQLANSLGTSWPIGTSVQDIRIEGPLRWKADTLAFDQAQVQVGANQAQGTVSLKTTGGQALIASTLAFDKLDIEPYLPSGSTDHASLAWQWWSKLVGTLSQPAAPHINADIRLSAKSLSSGSNTLGPAAATISMKDGKLSADIAEITMANGRATGQISIDFNRYLPKLALRGQLENVATGIWCEKIAGERYFEGQGRVIADLTSQGVSLQQIVGDLAGKIEFAVPENGNIALSLAALNSAHDTAGAQSTREIITRALRGSTTVNDLEAVWQIKDGVANLTKASASHAAGSINASGSYDLTRRTYDFRMLSFVGIQQKKAGSDSAATKKAAPSTPSAPPNATLLAVKTAKANYRTLGRPATPIARTANTTAAPEIELRPLTGPLKELQRFLGPNYAKIPRRGL